MPITLLFVVSVLKCATPTVVPADHTMTERDWASYSTAYNRCKELYAQSPCLKRFIIKAPDVYNAICGPEEESKP